MLKTITGKHDVGDFFPGNSVGQIKKKCKKVQTVMGVRLILAGVYVCCGCESVCVCESVHSTVIWRPYSYCLCLFFICFLSFTYLIFFYFCLQGMAALLCVYFAHYALTYFAVRAFYCPVTIYLFLCWLIFVPRYGGIVFIYLLLFAHYCTEIWRLYSALASSLWAKRHASPLEKKKKKN